MTQRELSRSVSHSEAPDITADVVVTKCERGGGEDAATAGPTAASCGRTALAVSYGGRANRETPQQHHMEDRLIRPQRGGFTHRQPAVLVNTVLSAPTDLTMCAYSRRGQACDDIRSP
eukprot:GHVU01017688.1.p2 GENE.GHVU01017688.1~~GHVU01017688.1.p2  ORF type:complete len:118 (-),score=8.20 GHVU01017688.1:519-872(-)